MVNMSSVALRNLGAGSKVSLSPLTAITPGGQGTDGASVVEGNKTRSTLLLNEGQLVRSSIKHSTNFPDGIDCSYTARIVANQPLRAKEASPFISNKYPVIVGLLRQNRCLFLRLDLTVVILGPRYDAVVVGAGGAGLRPLSVWLRLDLTPHA
jgi:hypothetical protein